MNTIALPTTNSEKDVFESVKIDALCNVMMKAAVDQASKSGLGNARQSYKMIALIWYALGVMAPEASMNYGGGVTPANAWASADAGPTRCQST